MRAWLFLAILSAGALAQEPDCSPGSFYVDEYGACIQPENDVAPMGYAEMYCQALGGHLLSIPNSFINSMITGIQLTRLTQKRGYLGLQRVNGVFVWTDGTVTNYTNWANGGPGNGDCVYLDSNDKFWRTENAALSCPPGSTYVDEVQSCLHADNNLVSFALADKYCQAYNGHLFSIHDLDTDSFLTGVSYAEISRGYFYIGGRKNGTSWTWTDGTPWDYDNWNAGEPRLNCVSVEKRTAKWTSVDCSNPLPFMCSIPQIINGGCTTTAWPTTPPATDHSDSTYMPPTIAPLTCQNPSVQPLYTCYNGWQYFPNTDSSYLVGYNSTTSAAEAYCQNQGGHLASIHSDAENKFLWTMCCPTSCSTRSFGDYGGSFLTGGKRVAGKMTWIDGTPLDYEQTICEDSRDSDILMIGDATCTACLPPNAHGTMTADNEAAREEARFILQMHQIECGPGHEFLLCIPDSAANDLTPRPIPEGFTLGPLRAEDVDFVLHHWPYAASDEAEALK
ncbi:unnamed protein product, partial [Mesorhabditis belari]|uniref:C-type lectin domain-containing protein n=1 Tax=Mesorhabditis belari TaxID=2138241 RepID=A0AAF3EER8_9BILA